MDNLEKISLGKIIDGTDFLKNETLLKNTMGYNIVDGINRSIQEQRRNNEKAMESALESKRKVHQAQIETAQNTSEMNSGIKTVIENQNRMIEILETQLKDINLTLDAVFGKVYDINEISEDAFQIFSKIEMQLSQKKKPDLKNLLIDKSGDIILQVMFLIANVIMKSKGWN